MSFLNKLTTGKRGRAQKVVIYGPESVGKSTLGAQFPRPIFLDVEDSTSQMDVQRLGRDAIPTLKALESALTEIIKSPDFDSIIVDTVDWLEAMCVDDVAAAAGNPKITGIEDFGYGKGYTILRERVTILLARFDAAIAAGKNVVLLAHAQVKKFEPPDGAGPYDRWELKLSKQVSPLIKEWSDMLCFMSWRTQVKERDKNDTGAAYKGIGGKERQMYFGHTAAWDAKNRHGLADVEKCDIAVIERAFKSVGAPWKISEGGETHCKSAPVAKTNGGAGSTPAPLTSLPVVSAPSTEAKTGALTPVAASQATLTDDPLPGVESPPLEPPTVDLELQRICGPKEAQVNAYLIKSGKIQPGQTWQDMPPEFAKRIKKNPAGFLTAAVRVPEGVAA